MEGMANPPDLTAATDRLSAVVRGVDDSQLDRPTPCDGRTVSQLLAHIHGLVQAFRASADKELGPLTDTNPDDDGWPQAPSTWRDDIPEHAGRLARAWQDPEAWTGMTRAGGFDAPAEAMGRVALAEVVLHGWDLARATGQEFAPDEATVQEMTGYAEGFEAQGTPGMFDAAVEVGADATDFDRVLARTGRDPQWQAPEPT